MCNLNLKGIWIPIEILTDKKLSDKEKTIYAIIIYLSKENNYWYCTNKTISELLNITTTQVSRLINSLKDNGYINVEFIYKETIDKFIKWICKKFDMGAENNLIRDFERENNTLLDAEKQVKREER